MKTAIQFACLCLCAFATLQLSEAQDWPALRGTLGDGIATTNGQTTSAAPTLSVAWKVKIGSGYSSVSIADGKAFTMYTDDDEDKLGCFNVDNGETVWEFSLDKKFKGENGSFDGPISTPLIHNGFVYALSCQGRLACVEANSGKLVWEKSFVDDFGAKQPLYGFATSPLIAANNLILQVGAENMMLVALDPASGEENWSCGNDSVNSQNPSVVDVAGIPVLMALGGKKLVGVNPESGEIVFEFEHGGGNGSAVMPVRIADDTVLITIDDAFSKAVKLRPIENNKLSASEEWQSRSIKNTYNIPTLNEGKLFAFSTRILTCVDPATGKAIWKSRKPGDGFLMAVDSLIAIITKEGSVHLVSASTDKFDQIADLKVFDDLVWTVPSFADGAIFIRSLGELARIDIVADSAEGLATGSEQSLPMSDQFASFIEAVGDAETDQANRMVDEFVAKQSSFPIIDSGVAHFVYRGPESDVALACDVFGARQERKMLPVGNSDMKYYTLQLEPTQRANYAFLVNFKPQTDKLNDRKMTSSMYAGEMEFAVRLRNEKPLEMSWFAMSEWNEPTYLSALPDSLYGKVVEDSLSGESEDQSLPMDVYLPPDYETATAKKYPVVYVLPQPGMGSSQFIQSADYLFANPVDGIRPSIIVIPKGRLAPGTEMELVKKIDAKYRTIAERNSRSIVGFGFTGGAALGVLGSNSEMFGAISAQSPLLFGTDGITKAVENLKQETRVYLDWGRFDMHNPVENWDLRKSSKEIFDALASNDKIILSGGMVDDSVDWSSWKNRFDKVLVTATAERKN